jgi:hypothetical protein
MCCRRNTGNNNSRFEFGASSNKQSGGNAADWFDDRNNFDNQGFRGDFGAFDEGYFKGGSKLQLGQQWLPQAVSALL